MVDSLDVLMCRWKFRKALIVKLWEERMDRVVRPDCLQPTASARCTRRIRSESYPPWSRNQERIPRTHPERAGLAVVLPVVPDRDQATVVRLRGCLRTRHQRCWLRLRLQMLTRQRA